MTTLATRADMAGPDTDAILAASFLASYREPTRGHYAIVVRQWIDWCHLHDLRATDAQRVHIELWMRDMEERQHLADSTISGKIAVIAGFYNMAVRDGRLVDSPCRWVKRPSVPRRSTTNGLTRPELLRVLELAKESSPQDHAIMCILGLNGLRVGELCAIRVEHVGRDHGYHTISIVREKSHEAAMIPLAPRTSWAVEQCMWGRTEGPLFMLRNEQPIDRRGVDRIVKRLCRKAGIDKRISPHSLRHTFVTLSLDAGAGPREVQNSTGHADLRMVSYYDRSKDSLAKNTTHLVAAFLES